MTTDRIGILGMAGALMLSWFILPAKADPLGFESCIGFANVLPAQVDGSNPITCPQSGNLFQTYSWRTGDNPQSSLTLSSEDVPFPNFAPGDTTSLSMALQVNNVIPSAFGYDTTLFTEIVFEGPGGEFVAGPLIALSLNFNETVNSAPCALDNPNNTVCDDIYTFTDPTGPFTLMFEDFFADFRLDLIPGDGVICNIEGGQAQCFTDETAPGTSEVFFELTYVAQRPKQEDGDYLCYKAFGGFLLQDNVNLEDQFESKDFDVIKPKMFCNPAVKLAVNDTPVPTDTQGFPVEDRAHQLAYSIDESRNEPRHTRQNVVVFNQFHPDGLAVRTLTAKHLMVPSGKSLDLSLDPFDPGFSTNHFKCYRVIAAEPFRAEISVSDQFIDPALFSEPPLTKNLRIIRPTKLCTPVSKNGSELVLDVDAQEAPHLMCYQVQPARGVKTHRRTDVRTANQFRVENLALKRELEFCAQSTKQEVSDPGAGG